MARNPFGTGLLSVLSYVEAWCASMTISLGTAKSCTGASSSPRPAPNQTPCQRPKLGGSFEVFPERSSLDGSPRRGQRGPPETHQQLANRETV